MTDSNVLATCYHVFRRWCASIAWVGSFVITLLGVQIVVGFIHCRMTRDLLLGRATMGVSIHLSTLLRTFDILTRRVLRNSDRATLLTLVFNVTCFVIFTSPSDLIISLIDWVTIQGAIVSSDAGMALRISTSATLATDHRRRQLTTILLLCTELTLTRFIRYSALMQLLNWAIFVRLVEAAAWSLR